LTTLAEFVPLAASDAENVGSGGNVGARYAVAVNFLLTDARDLPVGDALGRSWVGWKATATDDELWETNRGLWTIGSRIASERIATLSYDDRIQVVAEITGRRRHDVGGEAKWALSGDVLRPGDPLHDELKGSPAPRHSNPVSYFDTSSLESLSPAERASFVGRDRVTMVDVEPKVRLKDLVRQLMPLTPLTGDLGQADLAVLERWADPRALLRLGKAQLTAVIAKASRNQLGCARAEQWLAAAEAAVQLYADHPAVSFVDLAAEVATEIRLIRAIEAELAVHAAERETAYRWADPGQLARTLPGLGEVGGPVLTQHGMSPKPTYPAAPAAPNGTGSASRG
jgi:hypothetical protein